MIAFKDNTVKQEFESPEVDERLKTIMISLDKYCVDNNIPSLVVTDILRPDSPKSQHFSGEAFDMRLIDANSDGTRTPRYSLEEFAKILDFLEVNFGRKDVMASGRRARVAYAHGEGNTLHIHVSVDKK
jgi:hypothetical protein